MILKVTSAFVFAGATCVALFAGCTKQHRIDQLARDASEAEARGENDAAIASWTSVLRLDPSNSGAWLKLGALHETGGQVNQAIIDYTAYLRLPVSTPTNQVHPGVSPKGSGLTDLISGERVQALCRRAANYAKQLRYDLALADLDEAVHLEANDPAIYLERAAVCEKKGDPKEALVSFGKAIQAAPADASAYLKRGAFQARRGKLDEGISDLDEALHLDPQSAEALLQRGLAYSKYDQLDKALEDLNAAIRLSRKAAGLYAARGSVYSRMQRYEEAVADFTRATALKPGDLEALAGLAWLRATCPIDSFRNGHEAVALAFRACEASDFKTATTLETLAAAYAEAGDFDQAIKYQKLWLELVSADQNRREAMEKRVKLYEKHKPFRSNTDNGRGD